MKWTFGREVTQESQNEKPSSYGITGPYRFREVRHDGIRRTIRRFDRGGFEPRRCGALMDPALQALTGMMSSNKGENSIPHRVMFISVDMATGLYSFQALSSALYARRDEDKGCYIDNLLMRSGPLPAKRAADRQYTRRRRDDARGRTARRLFDKRPLNHARCPTQWQVRAILRSDQTTGPRCRSEVRNGGQPSRTFRHSHTRYQRGHVARNIQILVRASDRCRHRARGSEPLSRFPRTP